jgi:hypothetical protein
LLRLARRRATKFGVASRSGALLPLDRLHDHLLDQLPERDAAVDPGIIDSAS